MLLQDLNPLLLYNLELHNSKISLVFIESILHVKHFICIAIVFPLDKVVNFDLYDDPRLTTEAVQALGGCRSAQSYVGLSWVARLMVVSGHPAPYLSAHSFPLPPLR